MNPPRFNFGNSAQKEEPKTQVVPTVLNPQEAVLGFVKHNSYDKPYEIFLDGYDVHEAEEFLHRMRVALSRMRAKIKEAGQQPKPFKMLKHSIEQVNTDTTVIRLRLGNKQRVDMAAALKEISL